MKKMIPYEKLSKRAKRELDAAKRRDWGEISPVTRVSRSERVYNRQRAKRELPE